MRLVALACLAALACSKYESADYAALQRKVDEIADAEQPKLDALIARVNGLKGTMGHNAPGWEDMLKYAEMANDDLGLSPFTQTVPTLPGRIYSPNSLLGIRPTAHKRAEELAKARDVKQLQFLIADEQKRYDEGIAKIDGYLKKVEDWRARLPASNR